MQLTSRYRLKRIPTSGTTGSKRNNMILPVRLFARANGRVSPAWLCRMRPEHIPGVAAIERACFSQPWSERVLEAEQGNPNAVFFVAVSGGRVLGYVGMHRVLDEGYIANVAVDEAFRRHGLAAALMDRMFLFARENRLGFITLEVREGNAQAIRFYQRFGFGEVGRRKNFYANPTEDAILMTAFLSVVNSLR